MPRGAARSSSPPRDPEALATAKSDLAIRHGVTVSTIACDVTDPDPEAFFARLGETPGTVVMVAGLLGDQAQSAADVTVAETVMATQLQWSGATSARRREADGGAGQRGASSASVRSPATGDAPRTSSTARPRPA